MSENIMNKDEMPCQGLITVVTTNQCSARCAHCLMSSGPERLEMLTAKQIKDVMINLNKTHSIGAVVFTGGECTSLGEDLFEAIAQASSLGLATRVVTNGEWASDEQTTISMIKKFRTAGLNELNISYDDFHAVWIPVGNIVNIWRHSKRKGFASVVMAIGSGPRSRITPESMMQAVGETVPMVYDDNGRLRQSLPPAEDGTRYLISNTRILKIGRGRALRDDYCTFRKTEHVFSQCCPSQNMHPVITPRAHVGACCGINPDGNPILDLGYFERCDDSELKKVYLQAVRVLGPGYLIELVRDHIDKEEFGRKRYSSICEMCEDLTTSSDSVKVLAENIDRIKMDIQAERMVENIICQERQCSNVEKE